MKNVTSTASAENAFGNKIDAFDYNFDHVVYESREEIKAADLEPSSKEIIAFVNAREKANARAKAFAKELEARGIKKPELKDDVKLQIATIVKSLVASGKYDEATAEAQAKTLLGL